MHQLQDPALWSYARGRRKHDLDSEFWKLGHGELKYIECGQEAQQAWISSDFSRMWSVSNKQNLSFALSNLLYYLSHQHGIYPTALRHAIYRFQMLMLLDNLQCTADEGKSVA